MINLTIQEGNLGHTPVLKASANGTDYCKTTLAVSHWRGQDEDRETSWFDIVAFGKTAVRLSTFAKGDHIEVEGSLECVLRENRDGVKKMYPKIVVRMIHDRRKGDAPQPAPADKASEPVSEGPPDDSSIPF